MRDKNRECPKVNSVGNPPKHAEVHVAFPEHRDAIFNENEQSRI